MSGPGPEAAEPGLAGPFLALVRRDLRLAWRGGGAGALSTVFFVIVASLVPFGVGPQMELLARIAGGVVWIAALLSVLLALDRLFQADMEDGSLDQLALSGLPLALVVLAKAIAHWSSTAWPLIAAAPLIALLLNLPLAGLPALLAALAIGTPALSLIGAVGAALTVGLRRGGLLLSLLVLPLFVPVLIFGASAVEAAITLAPVWPHLALLGAVSLAALALCPLGAAAALRLNLG
ncbi:heme exporter protein CcmB [Futiania mangrovi]|uniref:Heme exporter protein B n=1 Tax=Futiania mangrovi TaxID=2959716 RepID=A0A9J6PJA7_9PROT|nr:heme exporter protein CcmB [Futiania mangrovii]MCP1336631.1 heme exporter protein CcmB [Futiania mangrovii]